MKNDKPEFVIILGGVIHHSRRHHSGGAARALTHTETTHATAP